jgi:hypothetical protein
MAYKFVIKAYEISNVSEGISSQKLLHLNGSPVK